MNPTTLSFVLTGFVILAAPQRSALAADADVSGILKNCSPIVECAQVLVQQYNTLSEELKLMAARTSKLEEQYATLDQKLREEIALRKALETKIPEIALSGIDILTDRSDPTQPTARVRCDKVEGKLVAGSCVGDTLDAGQAAVGPLFMGSDNKPASKSIATHIECRSYNHAMPMIAFAVCAKAH
jgi:hypothetical protein